MEKLQAFQAAACEGGFVAIEESEEDTGPVAEESDCGSPKNRICLDSLTKQLRPCTGQRFRGR